MVTSTKTWLHPAQHKQYSPAEREQGHPFSGLQRRTGFDVLCGVIQMSGGGREAIQQVYPKVRGQEQVSFHFLFLYIHLLSEPLHLLFLYTHVFIRLLLESEITAVLM